MALWGDQLRHPIGQLQRRYPLKLAQVVRYQRQPFAARVCGDVQVVDTDGLAVFFKRAANAAVG